MRISKWMAGAALAAFAATTAIGQTASSPLDPVQSAANVKAHMGFLASDLLQGRDSDSDGYRIAANYVASQFQQLGVKPGGTNGSFFQPVPMVSYRAVDQGSYVLRGKNGQTVTLTPGEDVNVGRVPGQPETKLSAPLVFVGYGLVAPEHGRDDYKGVNVKGKIVVVLSGAPEGIQTEERAYYQNVRNKRAVAAARGAVGMITVDKPSDEKRRPFKNTARNWQNWAMTWRQPDGKAFDVAPSVPLLGSISTVGAEKLFAGAPTTYAALAAAAESKAANPQRFALPWTLDVTLRTESKNSESMNVVGLIEGSDPKLKNEYVVLSAHLDHIGVSTSGEGDRINNGALDNASGVATTLEVGRAFRESGKAPRRSILLLAVTAEEKGLVGSEYFARNPTVPLSSIAADVNLDMPILFYDFQDVIAFGADRSTIGSAVRRAGERVGVALSPDPLPEEGLFTRSDHYRFVEVGVPSVFLMTGFQNGGEKAFRGFLAGCYHHPCDDLNQPIDYAAGAKFARMNYEIARELADADARPQWTKGDFFAGKFANKK
ncbi:M28 family peptidase [Phenylobacterium deserti]|uniref:Aminopeptidase n=1 Tax=Phenylobacterium deserti TaxID=1914756 RepID=A0A328AF21_9CAUL|nr:M28 family peptidase [Phenylobacterium deserti]RAK51388.1 aminopeptidase [Phenylobacterium deserti]